MDNLKDLEPGELLKIIADEAPEGLTDKQHEAWVELKKRLTRPESLPDWVDQYDETEKELKKLVEYFDSNDKLPGDLKRKEFSKLLWQAADDIKTLVDGLIRYEEEEKARRLVPDENGQVEIPAKYLPKGVGGSSFDPAMMKMHIDALYRTIYPGNHTMETKPWVIYYLLDKAGLL